MSGVSLPVTRPAGRALVIATASSRAQPLSVLQRLGFTCAEVDDPYAAAAEICKRPLVYGAVILSLLVLNGANSNDLGLLGIPLVVAVGALMGFLNGLVHVKLRIRCHRRKTQAESTALAKQSYPGMRWSPFGRAEDIGIFRGLRGSAQKINRKAKIRMGRFRIFRH